MHIVHTTVAENQSVWPKEMYLLQMRGTPCHVNVPTRTTKLYYKVPRTNMSTDTASSLLQITAISFSNSRLLAISFFVIICLHLTAAPNSKQFARCPTFSLIMQ